jgi:ERCC4-type nuclease
MYNIDFRQNMEIIIDDREKAVVPHFETLENGLPHRVDRLTVGDYAIAYKNHIIFTIERKTWKDLAASLRDLRSKNVQNLLDLRQKIGCHIIYLIEGNPIPSNSIKFARIPYKNLRAHLDHLAFRDNIHMVYSKDTKNTAYRINEIAHNYATISPSPLKQIDESIKNEESRQDVKEDLSSHDDIPNDKIEGGNTHLLKIKKNITPNMILYKLWCTLPCITNTTVSLVIDTYSILDYLLGKISTDELALLKYPSGRLIGPKRAKKMLKITKLEDQKNEPYYINLLSEIPLISRKTAKIILDTFTFKDLLESHISQDKLANLAKSKKVRIGNKAASNVFIYLGLTNDDEPA